LNCIAQIAFLDCAVGTWQEEYRSFEPAEEPQPPSTLDAFLFKKKILPGGEFDQYTLGPQVLLASIEEINIISWWANCAYRTLRQQAYDILSVPSISADCERIFSSSKRLINPYQMSLGDDIIEASECLKFWWMRNIIVHEQAR